MRLNEVESGDTLCTKILIALISLVSGMRLPDAARVAFYHKQFLSSALGRWAQATMRGESEWSVSERELMASLVARWNTCAFCVGAHRAVAIKGMDRKIVDAVLADYESADIDERFRAMLRFLQIVTLRPSELTFSHAKAVIESGVSQAAMADAVAALFNIVTRYADALNFAIPTETEFDKAAAMLLKRGYGA